jgi:hypothetical protein
VERRAFRRRESAGTRFPGYGCVEGGRSLPGPARSAQRGGGVPWSVGRSADGKALGRAFPDTAVLRGEPVPARPGAVGSARWGRSVERRAFRRRESAGTRFPGYGCVEGEPVLARLRAVGFSRWARSVKRRAFRRRESAGTRFPGYGCVEGGPVLARLRAVGFSGWARSVERRAFRRRESAGTRLSGYGCVEGSPSLPGSARSAFRGGRVPRSVVRSADGIELGALSRRRLRSGRPAGDAGRARGQRREMPSVAGAAE